VHVIEKDGVEERYWGMVMRPAIRVGNAVVFGSLAVVIPFSIHEYNAMPRQLE